MNDKDTKMISEAYEDLAGWKDNYNKGYEPEFDAEGNEVLAFVNDEPAECGCKLSFSSGGGEYSDVTSIELCPIHRAKK